MHSSLRPARLERRSPTTSSQDGLRDEAATQPRDGCAAGVGNGRALGAPRPEPAPYSIRGCPRGRSAMRLGLCECDPHSELASGEPCSTPRPAHAAGRRLSLRGLPSGERDARSFRSDPWAAVRRARCSILRSQSRIRGTGTLQVSRHETTGKA